MGDKSDDEIVTEQSTTALITDDREDDGDVLADLHATPRYYCGIGRFRPQCLQLFATKKFFTFILCVYCLIEGAVSTGELLTERGGGGVSLGERHVQIDWAINPIPFNKPSPYHVIGQHWS